MSFEGLSFFQYLLVGWVLVLLAARMAKKKIGDFLAKRLRGGAWLNYPLPGGMFEKNHLLSSKKCPSCAAQLPLSALFCEACEYNFLSGAVGFRNKLLPSSESVEEHARSRVARD